MHAIPRMHTRFGERVSHRGTETQSEMLLRVSVSLCEPCAAADPGLRGYSPPSAGICADTTAAALGLVR
jgi:hypothetical protein